VRLLIPSPIQFTGTAVAPLLLLAALPAITVAQAGCAQSVVAEQVDRRPTAWQPPLDRSISLHAREISLRDALGKLAAAADARWRMAPGGAQGGRSRGRERRFCGQQIDRPHGGAGGRGAWPLRLYGEGLDRGGGVPKRIQANRREWRIPSSDLHAFLDRQRPQASPLGESPRRRKWKGAEELSSWRQHIRTGS
jgi:hypothetical protein